MEFDEFGFESIKEFRAIHDFEAIRLEDIVACVGDSKFLGPVHGIISWHEGLLENQFPLPIQI